MTYEEYYNKYKDFYSNELNEQMTKLKDGFQSQKNEETTAAKKAAEQSRENYGDELRENAIQKMINKRQISEDMANLGLSDSGTKKTRMQGANDSYIEKRNNSTKNHNERLKEINDNLKAKLASIEEKESNAAAKLTEKYDKLAASQAQKEYNTMLKAKPKSSTPTERIITPSDGNSLISRKRGTVSRDYVGTLEENGIKVTKNEDGSYTYRDLNTNTVKTFKNGVNPYTNTVNPDIKYGAFKNGYQPDNISNIKLVAVDKSDYKGRGVIQSVWTLENNKYSNYYMWDGAINEYVEVHLVNGKWEPIK